MSKLSPFAVNKAIVAVLGSDLFNIKKLRNGDILVEVDKETQRSKLLKTTKLSLTMDNVISISVLPHYSLNMKKRVIKCPDIKDCTDEEILKALKDEGVIKLDRITVFQRLLEEANRNFYIDISKPDLTKIYQCGLLQGGCVTVYS